MIVDSVAQVELAHTAPNIGRIPLEDSSMYLVVPSVLDPSLAPSGKHTAIAIQLRKRAQMLATQCYQRQNIYLGCDILLMLRAKQFVSSQT